MMGYSSEEEIDIGGYDEEPEAQSMDHGDEMLADNYIGQQDGDVDITEDNEDQQETEDAGDDELEGDYDAANASEGFSEHGDSWEDQNKDEKDEELLALPPHGTQIFIANLSREATEEDLRNLCRVCGEVVDITINWEENTQRAHAFVTFRSRSAAEMAIKELNGRDCKDRKIRVSEHQTKNRLFLGNIPFHLNEEDVAKMVCEQGPGFQHIDLIKDPDDSSRNRGFGFADYYNHACAEKSMKNMIMSRFMLEDKVITVQWASKYGSCEGVKQVHVGNLPENITEEQMRELFSPHGEITKVLLFPLRHYGFVHFAEHSSAVKAVDKSEKYVIEGHELIATMARKIVERKPLPQQSISHYSYPFQMPNYAYYGYGANNVYGGFGSYQPALVRLHDGSFVYMVQPPANQVGTSATPFIAQGSTSYGARSNSNRSNGEIRSHCSPTDRSYSIRSGGGRRSHSSTTERNYSIRSSGERRSHCSPTDTNYSIRSSGERRSHCNPAQRNDSIRSIGERRSHCSPAGTNYSKKSSAERRSHCSPTERSSRNYGLRKSSRSHGRASSRQHFGPY